MKIYPAATPLHHISVGAAIAKLPDGMAQEQETVTVSHPNENMLYPTLEFVRFLTEQDGRMAHVWKRTK